MLLELWAYMLFNFNQLAWSPGILWLTFASFCAFYYAIKLMLPIKREVENTPSLSLESSGLACGLKWYWKEVEGDAMQGSCN